MVGRLFDRFGARPLIIPGSLATAAALGLFALLGPGPALAEVIAVHILFMAGFGTMMTPLTAESLGTLPQHLHAHGSAIIATLQQIAGAFGIALFVTIASHGATGGTPGLDGIRAAFTAAAVIGMLASAVSLFVRPSPRTSRLPPTPA